MNRVVLHIDMNSYFASVEQQDNPAWRGLPVGVCEHLGGIIIAASVEAKRWGISTGTPVWEARQLFPKIHLTKTHPNRYRYFTKKFIKLLEEYSKDVELYSIDEAFLDVTPLVNVRVYQNSEWKKADPWEEARLMALEIKKRMKVEVGDYLRCSVGIGWNKLMAKIASDKQKPDGLTIFRPEEKERLYKEIKLIEVPGIGSRQERNLKALGINTLKELRDYPKENLIARFGIHGLHIWNMGQMEGSWKEGFTNDPIKSMGHVYTLPGVSRKPELLWPVLSRLSGMVGMRVRKSSLKGNLIWTHVRTLEGSSFGGSYRLGYYTSDDKEIFLESMGLLKRYLGHMHPTPTQIAVTLAGLKPLSGQQSLFPKLNKRHGMLLALDKVIDKYGENVLVGGRGFLARHAIRDSVGFGRVKELDGYTFKNLGRFK